MKNLSRGILIPAYLLSLISIMFLGAGVTGCSDLTVTLTPASDSVKTGSFEAQIQWSEGLAAEGLVVYHNNVDISDQFVVGDATASADLSPSPGKKIFTAQLTLDVPLGEITLPIPSSATSIYTATTDLTRDQFPGELLQFQCTEGLILSPIQIPGMDLDAGFLDVACAVLPVSGLFPRGADVSTSPTIPIAYGLLPYQVTFGEDLDIDNGISMSPIDLDLAMQDAEDGDICAMSGVMTGTIIPVKEDALKGEVNSAMIQTLSGVSVSVLSGGTCTAALEFPADTDVIAFNYLAYAP